MLCAILLEVGCAVAPGGAGLQQANRGESTAAGAPGAVRRSSAEFQLPSALGPIIAKVEAGPSPDASGQPDKTALAIGGTGAAALPIGVAAPPIASAMIVGGAFLIVGSLAIYGTEAHQVEIVAGAVRDADLAFELERALQGRATLTDPTAPPFAEALIVPSSWGVVSSSGLAAGRHCFVAVVALAVTRGKERIYEDVLRIAPTEASADAPPPQCASLERFAEDGGRLVRETSRDYAEVLAVMVLERLGKIK